MAKINGFNPFGGDGDKLSATLSQSFIEAPEIGLGEPEEQGSPYGAVDEQALEAEHAQEAINNDLIKRATDLSLSAPSVEDTLKAAREEQVEAGGVNPQDMLVKGNPPSEQDITKAEQTLDASNQLSFKVGVKQTFEGMANGINAIAGGGLTAALAITGIPGTESANVNIQKLKDSVNQSLNGMRTIASFGELNNIEKSIDGTTIDSSKRTIVVGDLDISQTMNLHPLNTGGVQNLGIAQGLS